MNVSELTMSHCNLSISLTLSYRSKAQSRWTKPVGSSYLNNAHSVNQSWNKLASFSVLITYQNILISVHVFMAWFFQDTEVVVHFIKTVWRRNTLTQVNFLICVQFRTFKWCNCNIQPFSRARIFWKRDFALRLLESMSTGQRISLNCKSQTNTLEQIF